MPITNHFANATNLKDLLIIPNTNSGGFFWLAMLVLVWAVILIGFLGFGIETALLSASFIALIIGTLLVYMGLVGWQWLMMFLGIILFMFFYISWTKRRD